jgi:undecaprenyl-diphosphatase
MTIIGWCALVLTGWLFLAIAWDVANHSQLVFLDAKVAAWLHSHATPTLTQLMLAVSSIHSAAGIAAMSAILAFAMWRMREWWWMLSLALVVLGGIALNLLLKQAYERARPHFDDPMISLESFSFPSGHASGATAFWGIAAAFLVSRHYERGKREAIVWLAIGMVALVALSRMYLGAHYLSDVLAAIASTAAWLVLCLATVRGVVHRRLARR